LLKQTCFRGSHLRQSHKQLQCFQRVHDIRQHRARARGGSDPAVLPGGTLRARQRQAVAQFDQAAAQYRGTVLSAFSNVTDALAALQRDAETLQVQLYAEQTARQSLEITTQRFQAGAVAYLPLLDAQRVYQQAHILLVVAQAKRYEDTVALFTALGGGWWNRLDVAEDYATPAP
jgi:outer membrane protein TolC